MAGTGAARVVPVSASSWCTISEIFSVEVSGKSAPEVAFPLPGAVPVCLMP